MKLKMMMALLSITMLVMGNVYGSYNQGQGQFGATGQTQFGASGQQGQQYTPQQKREWQKRQRWMKRHPGQPYPGDRRHHGHHGQHQGNQGYNQ